MRRLSGWDTIHLQIETDLQFSNILGIVHLVPGGEPEEVISSLREAIAGAARTVTPLRQAILQLRWDPDLPIWEEKGDFDLSRHVFTHRVGGIDDVRRHAEELAATRLDRSIPLWRVHLYHDVSAGEVYATWVMHHCAIDAPMGKAMLALVSGIIDENSYAGLDEFLSSPEMSDRAVVADGIRRRLRKLRRLPSLLKDTVAMGLEWADRARNGTGLPMLFSGPRTSLNVTMDDRRHIELLQFDLDELEAIGGHFDCSINDVLLTAVAEAVRDELLRRGESVERSLTVMQPNVVDYDDEYVTEGSNTVSAVIARLRTDVGEVEQRVTEIHREMMACKSHHRDLGTNYNRAWCEYTGGFGLPQVVRALEAVRITAWTRPIYNVLCANVNGTGIPDVFFGHRISALYPVGAIYHGTGLSVSAWSLGRSLNVTLLASGATLDSLTPFTESMTRAISRLGVTAHSSDGPHAD